MISGQATETEMKHCVYLCTYFCSSRAYYTAGNSLREQLCLDFTTSIVLNRHPMERGGPTGRPTDNVPENLLRTRSRSGSSVEIARRPQLLYFSQSRSFSLRLSLCCHSLAVSTLRPTHKAIGNRFCPGGPSYRYTYTCAAPPPPSERQMNDVARCRATLPCLLYPIPSHPTHQVRSKRERVN